MSEYDRLTTKSEVGIDLTETRENIVNDYQKVVNRLAELEDDLASGKLVRVPCRVGDTVYEVFKSHVPPIIKETKIEKIVITAKGLRLRLARNSFYETSVSSIGKTIFFTKAKAEARIKELNKKIEDGIEYLQTPN